MPLVNLQKMTALTLIIVSALFIYLMFAIPIVADQVQNRQLNIDSPLPSVSATHQVLFNIDSTNTVGSILFEYCSNTSLIGYTCNPPSGLEVGGAALASQSGETGFSVHPTSSGNQLIITRTPAPTIPGTLSYSFNDITNPTDRGTYYLRITTHGSVDGSGAYIDEGGVAFSIVPLIQVSAYVPPILIFCVGVQIDGFDCSTASGSIASFGELSADITKTVTFQFLVGTNAFEGYTVFTTGTTLTAGNKIIPSPTEPALSLRGVSQFGANLVSNSQPLVGTGVQGPGVGQVESGYNIINHFKYQTGESFAYAPTSTEFNKYTVSYIANINENQSPGIYTTTITYVALATF